MPNTKWLITQYTKGPQNNMCLRNNINSMMNKIALPPGLSNIGESNRTNEQNNNDKVGLYLTEKRGFPYGAARPDPSTSQGAAPSGPFAHRRAAPMKRHAPWGLILPVRLSFFRESNWLAAMTSTRGASAMIVDTWPRERCRVRRQATCTLKTPCCKQKL